jgi:ethanolamine permease
MSTSSSNTPHLAKTLGPLMLWGLGVGYVISGMYFGWNLGLEKGGTLGLAVATIFIIIMYACFSFSYTELACAIPKAGGAFDYAERSLGSNAGFVAGMAQIIEFVFAPPAISIAIGTYINLEFPAVDITLAAIVIYIIFTALNVYGVKAAATFELIVTVLAVGELILFAGVTLPHFKLENLQHNPLPHGWSGAFAAIPFAIWFFLGIEGVANVAEETRHPQKDILKGFGWAIVTLIVLCILTFTAAVGVNGWESVVFLPDGTATDSPLPMAMANVVSTNHLLYKILVGIGLFGLIASFHGLTLAGGRATFEFGRQGNAPRTLGKVHKKFGTPANALIANACFGILALLTGKTAEIISLSVFAALVLYIISMVSVLVLRKKEPALPRPFKVPFFPLAPIVALVIATVSLIAMIVYIFQLSIIFFGILAGTFIVFKLVKNDR